ncbi:GPI transamidase component PIG-T [Blyttiomyces helicus]|uniref:GPI transamidase component PIG-T n=1 Tax=Blyttiomyces helicus TaxID=388810 RepID=A0A4P9WMX8_9FUNG|nr:GPI transamidase component PIG-T [Blyttiomyces helicus]|eukprot:RKO93393.1 GPI transamidase component PIG-T [Blyttiomyces helicus]
MRSPRAARLLVYALLLFFATSDATASTAAFPADELFDEDLSLTQFPDGKILAVFNFTRRLGPAAWARAQANHYSLLPRPIGELIHSFGVEELHLTFTQGRWNYDRWGYSPVSAASGVQLWSWFNATSIDAKWKGLTNALSGLFCASLNFIDQSNTAEPLMSFDAEGNHGGLERSFSKQATDGFQLRYGSLPREAVCTENLTPWAKLLPCQSKAGIASLFNAYKLYDSNFHSMGTHIRPICEVGDCLTRQIEFQQTLAVVLDPIRFENRKDWSLEGIFNRGLDGRCPLARSSSVHITVPREPASQWALQPLSEAVSDNGKTKTASYDLAAEGFVGAQLGVSWADPAVHFGIDRETSFLKVHRFLTGYGQERGGLAVDFRNFHPTSALPVTYFESVPWILKVYLHTLTIDTSDNSTGTSEIVQNVYFQPGIDRLRPTVLEMSMVLPPASVVTVSIEFDKAFIKYTEHPPDANRGFDVGYISAVITFPESPRSPDGKSKRMFTETLLISLPTPDFSMPYNVITMTSTLMALFFGSTFNLLTRQFRPVERPEAGESRWKRLMFWKKR